MNQFQPPPASGQTREFTTQAPDQSGRTLRGGYNPDDWDRAMNDMGLESSVQRPANNDVMVATTSQLGFRYNNLSTGLPGTVFIGGSTFSADVLMSGYVGIGFAAAPTNTTPGDLTVKRLSVGDVAITSGVEAQINGDMAVTGWTRVGSATAPANTTAGDLTATRLFVNNDSDFSLTVQSSNPRLTLAANDYLEYDRTNDVYIFNIAGAAALQIRAAGVRAPGYLSAIGNTNAPANTTAGDVTGLRGHFGTDGAFTSGVELEVQGDFHVSGAITGAAWQSVAFNAANFTANAGATWGLTSGDQVTFAWDQVRKTVHLGINLNTTSITVATPTILSVALPFTPAKAMAAFCYLNDNGTPRAGIMYVAAGVATLNIQRLDGGAFALAANTTQISGTMTMEVQ